MNKKLSHYKIRTGWEALSNYHPLVHVHPLKTESVPLDSQEGGRKGQRFSTIAISDKINKDSNQPVNQGRFHHGTTGKLSMGKLVRGNS